MCDDDGSFSFITCQMYESCSGRGRAVCAWAPLEEQSASLWSSLYPEPVSL